MLKSAVPWIAGSLASLAFLTGPGVASGATVYNYEDLNERLVAILRTTNKAQVNRYVPVVYDLKHVNPYAIVRFINRTLQLEEGAFYTFASPSGNSGKVLVILPQHQIEGMSALISELDRPNLTSSGGEARAYVKLKHRSAADPDFLNTLISYGAPGNMVILNDPPTNSLYLEDTPFALEDFLADLEKNFDVPTAEVLSDVTIYEVDVNNDGKLGLDFHAWKNGPGRNLFALGGFSEFEKVRDPLISLQNSSTQDLGSIPIFDSGSDILALPNDRMNSHGYNVAYNLDVPSAYFDYLTVKGQARVVTSTRLSVLNNHQGSISSGEQFLFYSTQNGGAPTAGTRPPGFPLDPTGDTDFSSESFPDNRTVVGEIASREVSSRELGGFIFDRAEGQPVQLTRNTFGAEAGVFLDIIPTIGEDMINMDVAYSVVTLAGFDGEGRPSLSARSNVDQIRVRDGEEIVLGGLTRESKIKSTSKVPILGSLPVIGYAFGGESTSAKRTMVVVVMKNSIVRNFNNLSESDNELVSKVSGETPVHLPTDEYGWDMYLFDRQPTQ